MELILISSPVAVPDEMSRLNAYFQMGLKRFHLRKPYYSKEKIEAYLHQVDPAFYPYLSLHSHHELGEKFGIKRLHYPEHLRQATPPASFEKKLAEGKVLSTSVHSVENLSKLPAFFSYALIGPVYPSISKKRYGDPFDPDKWKRIGSSDIPAVAIGGIESQKIHTINKLGFKGAALLGSIWSVPHDMAMQHLEDCIHQCKLSYHE
jgi:thiamine-phosphate pyrophosphorylase